MTWFFKKSKEPKFDYYEDMEIAQEISLDPFSEEPRSRSHSGRLTAEAFGPELGEEEDYGEVKFDENGSDSEESEAFGR